MKVVVMRRRSRFWLRFAGVVVVMLFPLQRTSSSAGSRA
jgi:hypothetical protein